MTPWLLYHSHKQDVGAVKTLNMVRNGMGMEARVCLMYYSRLWLNKLSNKCVQQTREWAVVNFKSRSLTSIMLIITLIFFQEIQVCIIKLVIQCQQSPYPSYPIPFSSAECRQALYHVLLCFLLSNTPHVPSPINHAVKLFSAGLQDADLKVRVWGKNPGERGWE